MTADRYSRRKRGFSTINEYDDAMREHPYTLGRAHHGMGDALYADVEHDCDGTFWSACGLVTVDMEGRPVRNFHAVRTWGAS